MIKHNKHLKIAIATISILLLVSIFVFKKDNDNKTIQREEGFVWATEFHITYTADKSFYDSIQVVLNKVDNSISPFNKKSLITKINENTIDSVDEYFIRLYNASSEINKISDGAFDPTVSPLVNSWGFGYKSGVLPDSLMIDSLLEIVGITKTSIANNRLIKTDPRISFNFSAIAKGMGCDEVGLMLSRNGVDDYMVEIGGEIALKGLNSRGEKWRISIDMPEESNDSVIHNSALRIATSNCGIATSGNYRNYKIIDGKKVAHTINPRTGYPEISNLLSATIIAPNCMLADAYATTCMVLGFEKSKDLIKNNPQLAALFIIADDNGKLMRWESPNFSKLIIK